MFGTLSSLAQPSDRQFSFVTFDSYGYHNNYKVYSCSVDYPNSLIRSDSLELAWEPDLKTLKIIDTLQLVKVTNDSLGIPYPYYYRGSSFSMTNILMIIRDNKDTMMISTAGAQHYLVVSPDKQEHGLPFIYPFQRGLFYLQRLIEDGSVKRLFFSIHRAWFLGHYDNITNPYMIVNRSDVNISYIKMNKKNYHADDTLCITLTGKVLNDGGCGGGSILWTLQKFENDKWINEIDNCCSQMDCGIGLSILNNTTIPLVLLKDKINQNIATYPTQREIPNGKYRFVIYDDIYQLYFTEEFIIE
jgi:hypothetical protein